MRLSFVTPGQEGLWRGKPLLRCLPVLLPILILVGTGLHGIDFGLHWDERPWQIGPVKHMIAARTPLPGYYNYPSFDYWLNLLILSPAALSSANGGSIGERLLHAADSHDYLLRLRTVYLLVTSLTLLWVYLLVLERKGSWLEALIAASALGCSWEVAYHLRWVATDGMLMQFAVLTVLLAVHAMHCRSDWWWIAAAAVAGLGCATKYPGGLLILPVLLGTCFSGGGSTRGQTVIRFAKVVIIFFFVYLAITPATILHPGKVVAAVSYEMKHYATGHGGHTVGRGLEHAWRMCTYFATVLFSPYWPVALLFFALSILGIGSIIARNGREGMVLLILPLFYFLYFAAQRAMVVRNLLAIAPFLAIAAARGAAEVSTYLSLRRGPIAERSFRRSGINALWCGLLVTGLFANACWLVASANSIVDRRTDRFVHEAGSYLRTHPKTRFLLSPRVAHDLQSIEPSLRNLTSEPAQADAFVLYAREGMRRWHDWPANRRHLTEAVFGPREVDFNIYPNWWGDDRIIVIGRDRAKEIGLQIAGVSEDSPPPPPLLASDRVPTSAGRSSRVDASVSRSWSLPSIDPRSILTRADVEGLVRTHIKGPLSGGWELDGTATTFLGQDGTIISLAIISTSAFDLQRHDPGSRVVPGVGLSAYAIPAVVPGDVRLFARSYTNAVVVHVSGGPGAADVEAKLLAQKALERLDANSYNR